MQGWNQSHLLRLHSSQMVHGQIASVLDSVRKHIAACLQRDFKSRNVRRMAENEFTGAMRFRNGGGRYVNRHWQYVLLCNPRSCEKLNDVRPAGNVLTHKIDRLF